MFDAFKRGVLELLRVPPEPQPPAGSPGSIRVFRAARNYYRYSLLKWGMKQVGALLGILFLLTTGMADRVVSKVSFPPPISKVLELIGGDDEAPTGEHGEDEAGDEDGDGSATRGLFFWIEIFGLVALFVQMPLTWTMVRFDYEMRWYIATDRSLRIREGVALVREMTMTYANVQNLTIEQGPLQRLLGISDLRVRTAGGGSESSEGEGEDKGSGSMHIGYLRGVDNAEDIRDLVLDRLRRLRDSGLGDPDDVAATPTVASGAPLDAARELLEEVRALRKAVASEV